MRGLVLTDINIVTYILALFGSKLQASAKRRRQLPRTSPYVIHLTEAEKIELTDLARKYTSPYYLVVRAKVVLLAAQGRRNDQIAKGLSLPRQIVSKWRKRFFEQRLAGLEDQTRTGRPPVFSPSRRRRSKGPRL